MPADGMNGVLKRGVRHVPWQLFIGLSQPCGGVKVKKGFAQMNAEAAVLRGGEIILDDAHPTCDRGERHLPSVLPNLKTGCSRRGIVRFGHHG